MPAFFRAAFRAVSGAVLTAAGLTACSPVLDWREVRSPGAPVQWLMPCRPATQQRELPLAGAPALLTLQACSAGDLTWAMVSADVGDPARVGPALQELLATSARKLNASSPTGVAFAPPGSTPNAHSLRTRLAASAPEGGEVQMDSAVFTQGTWVMQASVLGPRVDAEAAEVFFSGLRATP